MKACDRGGIQCKAWQGCTAQLLGDDHQSAMFMTHVTRVTHLLAPQQLFFGFGQAAGPRSTRGSHTPAKKNTEEAQHTTTHSTTHSTTQGVTAKQTTTNTTGRASSATRACRAENHTA